jgi:hypothetical protein
MSEHEDEEAAKSRDGALERAATVLGLTVDVLGEIRGAATMAGAWPAHRRREREHARDDDEIADDLRALREITGRMNLRWAVGAHVDEPAVSPEDAAQLMPIIGYARRLHRAVDDLARHWEGTRAPAPTPLRQGERHAAEDRRHDTEFVMFMLKEAQVRRGAAPSARNAALLAIAFGVDEPIKGNATATGSTPWQRRVDAWRTAMRRLSEKEPTAPD